MFSKKFKSAAATNQSGAMDAGNHFKTAVDNRDHFKNGASLKSLMSRGNIMQRIFLFFAGFCICATSTFAQDIIVTKDSKRIEAKVIEVNEDNIKYKIFDNQDGPVYSLSISRIDTIILYQQVKKDIDCTPKILDKKDCQCKGKIYGGIEGWYPFFEKQNREGFTKRMIPFEYLPTKKLKDYYQTWATWSSGLYVNYDDQLIRFRDGDKCVCLELPFQCIYSVGIGQITSTRESVWGGDIITVFKTFVGDISIQIVISDPKGGLKTYEIKMLTGWKKEIGSDEANAATRCAADIFEEIKYIINKY